MKMPRKEEEVINSGAESWISVKLSCFDQGLISPTSLSFFEQMVKLKGEQNLETK